MTETKKVKKKRGRKKIRAQHCWISIQLDPEEKEILKKDAESENMSLHEFCRVCLGFLPRRALNLKAD